MSMTQKEKAEAIKKQLVVINQLLKKPENKLCADCKRTSPTWASVNLGVFVCINCSGCHREIGVHITKIRSTNLDVWPKEVLDNFKIINNKIANKYWECKLKSFNFKSLHSDNYKLVQFIRDKYENKKWVDKKKEPPMSLIIKGKIKKFKKLYCEDEDEEEEEIEEEKESNKKNKKKKKNSKKQESDNESEKSDDSNESDNGNTKNKKKLNKSEDEEENEEEDNNENENEDDKKNENEEEDFEEVQEKKQSKIESKSPNVQRAPQQINNIFLNVNPNQNQQNILNFNNANTNNNNSNNNNILDFFNSPTESDKK